MPGQGMAASKTAQQMHWNTAFPAGEETARTSVVRYSPLGLLGATQRKDLRSCGQFAPRASAANRPQCPL